MKMIPTNQSTLWVNPKAKWAEIIEKPITRKHSLADYADFSGLEEGKEGKEPTYGILTCFRHKGKLEAISEYIRTDSMWGLGELYFVDSKGKKQVIHAIKEGCHALGIQLSDNGEAVKCFELESRPLK